MSKSFFDLVVHRAVSSAIVAAAGCTDSAAALVCARALPAQMLLDRQSKSGLPFFPAIDGVLIVQEPLASLFELPPSKRILVGDVFN